MASPPPTAEDTGLPTWLRRLMQMIGTAFIVAAPLLHAGGIAQGSTAYLLTAGAALLLFSVLDRIEAFSAWGLSAKLRAAEKAAQKAAASAEEMRALAVAVSRILLGLAQAGGRWGGPGPFREAAVAETTRLLGLLKVSDEERTSAFSLYNAYTLFDLARAAFNAVRNATPAEREPEVTAYSKEMGNRFAQSLRTHSSGELRSWAIKVQGLSAEAEAALIRLAAAEAAVARGEMPLAPSD